jgi:hypothetical protein
MQNVVVKHNHAGILQEGVIDVFMIWTITNMVEVDIVRPFSPDFIEVSIVVDTEILNDLGTASLYLSSYFPSNCSIVRSQVMPRTRS